MTTSLVALQDVCRDAGTQVRASLYEHVIHDYATLMQHGIVFPPIVLFRAGDVLYLADGFHRVEARLRMGCETVLAHVYDGTQQDALWYAIGANKANGHRLTGTDTQRAIKIALATWPAKTQQEIADQVGCSQQFVSQVTATCEVLREPQRFAKLTVEKADAVAAALADGKSVRDIARTLKVSVHTVARVRDRRGIKQRLRPTPKETAERRAKMREMAAEGYTSRQIAAAVGMSFEGCRHAIKTAGIYVHADVAIGKTLRHNSTRIVERIVMDAENLTECASLIDFASIDRTQLPAWLRSLKEAQRALSAFIRRLTEEAQYGEAAVQPATVESPSRPDQQDACATGTRGAA